jgi:hypothetical protein
MQNFWQRGAGPTAFFAILNVVTIATVSLFLFDCSATQAQNEARTTAQQALPAWSGQQPIAFPHNRHIAAGMQCTDCHAFAAVSPQAGIPSVSKCALCHSVIATQSPEIKKVMTYAALGREIPWKRVYGFNANAHVLFRHDMHLLHRIACTSCHGDMSHVTTAHELVRHNMGTCVSCHRQQNAPTDCWVCHY